MTQEQLPLFSPDEALEVATLLFENPTDVTNHEAQYRINQLEQAHLERLRSHLLVGDWTEVEADLVDAFQRARHVAIEAAYAALCQSAGVQPDGRYVRFLSENEPSNVNDND